VYKCVYIQIYISQIRQGAALCLYVQIIFVYSYHIDVYVPLHMYVNLYIYHRTAEALRCANVFSSAKRNKFCVGGRAGSAFDVEAGRLNPKKVNFLQHIATYRITLQHTATYCNKYFVVGLD